MAKHKGRKAAKRKGPVAFSPAEIAAMLQMTAACEWITEADIRADIAAGAPANAEEKMDLVQYLAWLAKRHGYGEKENGRG